MMNHIRFALLGAALCIMCCLLAAPCLGASKEEEFFILIEDSFAPDIAQHIDAPEYNPSDYTPTHIRIEERHENMLSGDVTAQVTLCTLSQDGLEADLLMLAVQVGNKSDYRLLNWYLDDLDLFFADVDGDGAEEIIIHQFNGGNGGFGQYDSFVLKVTEQGLQEISIPSYWDTGFKLDVDTGFTYVVRNAQAGFKFSFVNKNPNHFSFDESGNLLEGVKEFFTEDVMLVDTYFVFEPVDVDQDGVFEVMTAQYCSLDGHTDYIGSACTILRYDAQADAMKVVRAGFWPEQPADTLDEDSSNPTLEHYLETWYK